MPLEVWLYRRDNGDGTAKDWAYPVTTAPGDTALTVFFGRTGSALRQAVTPATECRRRDPERESVARVAEKLGKGYRLLGMYQLADNRRDLTPIVASRLPVPPDTDASAPDDDPEPAAASLYWRRVPEKSDDGAIRRVLWEAVPVLCEAGWLSEDSHLANSPNGLWLEITDCQEQGCVPLDEANAMAIACLLLLARADVGVSLANEAGELVTRWPGEVPVAAGILETLGLKPRDLNQLLAASGDDDWFF